MLPLGTWLPGSYLRPLGGLRGPLGELAWGACECTLIHNIGPALVLHGKIWRGEHAATGQLNVCVAVWGVMYGMAVYS